MRTLLDDTPDREAPRLPLRDFKTNYANSRLMLLTLASMGPQWPDGKAVDIAAEFEIHGAEAVTQFIPDHKTEVASRGFWPTDSKSRPEEVHDDAVLESHVINAAAAKALRAKDADDFLRLRGSAIQELAHGFLDSRMEPHALIRPSLRDLALSGLAEEEA